MALGTNVGQSLTTQSDWILIGTEGVVDAVPVISNGMNIGNGIYGTGMSTIGSAKIGVGPGTTAPRWGLDVNTTFGLTQSGPAADNTPCVAGEIRVSALYFFACTSANTWKRAALSSY